MKQMKTMALVLALTAMVSFTAFADDNSADVTQGGSSNTATANQVGASNVATINQYGSNLADVSQKGEGNKAEVNQGSDSKAVSNNYQPGYAHDWKQGAYVDQTGNVNTASITMTENGIGAKILQDGDTNTASQNLGAYSSYTNADAAHMAIEIDQVGDNNQAAQTTVKSYGTYGIQSMLIEQNGNANVGTQSSVGGMASTMQIGQHGNSNNSSQHQDGMYDTAIAKMEGDGNVTIQNQVSSVWGAATSHNSATIDIAGNTNNSSQHQFGVSNSMDIDINGNGNNVNQEQLGDNNLAKAIQKGSNNMICQVQTGNGNSSIVTQTGNNNMAKVTQSR